MLDAKILTRGVVLQGGAQESSLGGAEGGVGVAGDDEAKLELREKRGRGWRQ